MKQSKRYLAIIMVVILALSLLAACGPSQASSNGDNSATGGSPGSSSGDSTSNSPGSSTSNSPGGSNSDNSNSSNSAGNSPGSGDSGNEANTGAGEVVLDGEILFGVSTCITGAGAVEGQGCMDGVDLACFEINSAGGVLGKKLVPVYEDDQYTAEGGLIAIQRLTSRDDIVAIMGLQKTVSITAGIHLIDRPTLYGAASATLWELDNPWCFRTGIADPVCSTIAGNWAVENWQPTKVWIFHNSDDVGVRCADSFQEVCEENGIPYYRDQMNVGDRDFTGQLLKAQSEGCDAAFMNVHATEMAILARQMHEFDFKIPVMGSQGVGQQMISMLPDLAYGEGMYSYSGGSFSIESTDPVIIDWIASFRSFYGRDPIGLEVNWYNVTYLLAHAIEEAGSTDKDAIVDALYQVKNFPGVASGGFTCDYRRDLSHVTNICRINGDAMEVVLSAEANIVYRNGDHN